MNNKNKKDKLKIKRNWDKIVLIDKIKWSFLYPVWL
jgi:hypothetical protein